MPTTSPATNGGTNGGARGDYRILIMGVGSIGSVVGGMLTRAGHDVTLLDQWPPPDASHVGWRPRWAFPGRPLTLHGRVDLVLGRPGHGHRIAGFLPAHP